MTKRFGSLAAVKDLSFTARRGEILGIGGPNGAGKTTLFDVLSGLNPATSGRVRLDGQEITRAAPEAICHAGLARTFQLNACFDSLTVRENVQVGALFGRAARGLPGLRPSPEAEEATEAALALVGLEGKAGLVAGALPVLDRKLLMLAGAMATRPKLLLMDEPVGGLTHAETDQMMAAVRRIKAQGVTIILIEHVMRFLVALSDRVMILHHGERIYEGPPAGLVADRTVVDVYLGEGASARLAALLRETAP
ncbi:ABC transporter ATP-binding protein [Tabrizicola sp. TH137]|uniref:ABC transporter ATP-binding protein n=1 Tax=Tabrizicola sp. TH137 TaxID=2067452 RepID=UPI0020B33435|nr:ABC transporter ATP-binding protein [Tabrizicola sp. TH137]